MTNVKTKSGSNKAISVQYTLVNEEKSHLEFIEQAPPAKSRFLKINSTQHNTTQHNVTQFSISFRCSCKEYFSKIVLCICPNNKMHLSKLNNIFVKIFHPRFLKFQFESKIFVQLITIAANLVPCHTLLFYFDMVVAPAHPFIVQPQREIAICQIGDIWSEGVGWVVGGPG